MVKGFLSAVFSLLSIAPIQASTRNTASTKADSARLYKHVYFSVGGGFGLLAIDFTFQANSMQPQSIVNTQNFIIAVTKSVNRRISMSLDYEYKNISPFDSEL